MHEPNPVPSASPLNEQLLRDWRNHHADVSSAALFYCIKNSDRTFGARLASELVQNPSAPRRTVDVRLRGTAGQSFGAFAVPGMSLHLTGEANDYVGKGLSGGQIVIASPFSAEDEFAEEDVKAQPLGFVIAGNTCLYGATSGEVFLAGRAGERFAVRNSGAEAVVEGVGDHGCEYMTGGTVIVLGSIGYNFGAGMTGGTAYIWDDGWALKRINMELVSVQTPTADDFADIRRRVERHVALAHSAVGQALLDNWETASRHFIKILPKGLATEPKQEAEPVVAKA
jgi:glutamate synthase domain-containing protein 3